MSFYLNVETIDGIKKEIVYNVNDFPINEYELESVYKKKKGGYFNVSCAFDIETTTIETRYTTKKINGRKRKVYTESNPFAFMYQWQFCLNKRVCFGRTWEEFQYLLERLEKELNLNDKKTLVCYVHNLAYEFMFMHNFVKIDDMFCKDTRKPIYFRTQNNIEFRCSYFLSNMSLAKFCENSKGCTHYKLEDKYRYDILRTPDTQYFSEDFTEIELAYCYNDVYGLCECIDALLVDDTIISIPLTNTGFVRREYRKNMNTEANRILFENIRLYKETYEMCRRAFRGGNCHANRFFANHIIPKVYSFDIQSSYPSVMMYKYVPMGQFLRADLDNMDNEMIDLYLDTFCCLLDITIYYPRCKSEYPIPYIDIAHCNSKSGIINDNGRVLGANMITLTCTEIDLKIIRETYNFDGIEVNTMYYCKRGLLPLEMRQTLLKFYTDKTQLKGVDGYEYEYMKSKNKVNSSYGMCVTAIDHDDITFDFNTLEWNTIKADLTKSLNDFYKSRNNFLSYQWGVWIVTQSRYLLQVMLNIVKTDVVYVDTDSIKFVNEKHIKEFEKLNLSIIEECEKNDLPAYAVKDNIKYYLGIWDREHDMTNFKTLGAKKYCYNFYNKKKQKEEFEITVAGMSKKLGSKVVGSAKNFNIGMTYSNVGRTTSWYNEEKPHKITINGCTFTTASNIGILEATYTLGVTDEYWEILQSANDSNFLKNVYDFC